ncbi:hypothetical protein LUQ84_002988 [Hamiltosporidium tvaerminnensis]|nr:hypothetical protein LUQ84_002988 [Hamiltosporidium tvaerminnensis]
MPFLCRSEVPLYFKLLIIKACIIPIVMYGSELWGMSKVRIVSVGCGVTRSLAAAFGCRENFSQLVAFRECDIQPLYEKAAMSRVRGFLKWQESRTIIRDLLNGKFTARKRT